MDAQTTPPVPANEPVRDYAPGSPERSRLRQRLAELARQRLDLSMTIGGVERAAAGDAVEVVQPHRHSAVLGTLHEATDQDVQAAVDAAVAAGPAWRELPFDERAAVFLRAADLLSGPWRDTLNAATMLGQSKTVQQAEIDAACEFADFLRFNVHYAHRILSEQPVSSPGVWNRFDHRPLEGFVLAITPFNFTAIAGNLPTVPALLGVPVVWKPSPTQQFAAHFTMRMLESAGLPAGVVNMVTGYGEAVSRVAVPSPYLAGIHFTGSTATFRKLWANVGSHISGYRSYPRIVGETGGKDFVIGHPSADPAALVTGLVRGAFEYQGQKCSAASRAYLPRSLWEHGLRDELAQITESLAFGDVTDFANFGGAVIDRRAFRKHQAVFDSVAAGSDGEFLVGGKTDESEGFFVQPTIILGADPTTELFSTEFFGPILSVYVYEDADWPRMLAQAADIAPYALTGAVFATDRAAIDEAARVLRFSAGNFYVNDKPTGAVVGQQPFGGGRASGTNDKAGSIFNVMRWISPRVIKENFVPPTDHRYPHMS